MDAVPHPNPSLSVGFFGILHNETIKRFWECHDHRPILRHLVVWGVAYPSWSIHLIYLIEGLPIRQGRARDNGISQANRMDSSRLRAAIAMAGNAKCAVPTYLPIWWQYTSLFGFRRVGKAVSSLDNFQKDWPLTPVLECSVTLSAKERWLPWWTISQTCLSGIIRFMIICSLTLGRLKILWLDKMWLELCLTG